MWGRTLDGRPGTPCHTRAGSSPSKGGSGSPYLSLSGCRQPPSKCGCRGHLCTSEAGRHWHGGRPLSRHWQPGPGRAGARDAHWQPVPLAATGKLRLPLSGSGRTGAAARASVTLAAAGVLVFSRGSMHTTPGPRRASPRRSARLGEGPGAPHWQLVGTGSLRPPAGDTTVALVLSLARSSGLYSGYVAS